MEEPKLKINLETKQLEATNDGMITMITNRWQQSKQKREENTHGDLEKMKGW